MSRIPDHTNSPSWLNVKRVWIRVAISQATFESKKNHASKIIMEHVLLISFFEINLTLNYDFETSWGDDFSF